jgi:hypothetical protein
MPSRNLPTLTRAEVEAHSSKSSCYVTIGTKVYDVTDFLDDHPGGGSLILDYGGKDIESILTSTPKLPTMYSMTLLSVLSFLKRALPPKTAPRKRKTSVHKSMVPLVSMFILEPACLARRT